MKILVTGAAGYIGSVVTRQLADHGNFVIALDNLHQGHIQAVDPRALFVKGDIHDERILDEIFATYSVEVVVHLAAQSLVEDSMKDPRKYFNANVVCGINLFDAMLSHEVRKLVFSSSAAVYGSPFCKVIREGQPLVPPLNTYGESKLMLERILQRYDKAYGLRYVALRYFNAAGAMGGLGEDHNPETHLIPIVLRSALGLGKQVSVFGTDYPTNDGSCVRDFVHVSDIAKAHLLAFEYLEAGNQSGVFNIGSGKGYSVLNVLEAARRVTGMQIPASTQCRRQGDPPALVADSGLAKAKLGWRADYDQLDAIVESAWSWQVKHPHGYANTAAPNRALLRVG